MSTYVLLRNPKTKKTAMYRDGALKATWEDQAKIDNKKYIDEQVAMWVGVSGDPVIEKETDALVFPPTLEKPKAPKKAKVTNATTDDAEAADEDVQGTPEA